MHDLSAIGSARFSRSQVGYVELLGRSGGFLPNLPVAAIYVMTQGRAWLTVDRLSQAVEVEAGDVVILPGGCAHSLGSEPGCRNFEPVAMIAERRIREFDLFRHGSGPPRTQFMAACCTWEDFGGLRAMWDLPDRLVLRAAVSDSGSAMASLVSLIDAEAALARPASPHVVNRLCDSLMLHALASLPQYEPARAESLLAPGNPGIARAVRAVNAALDKHWTCAGLARLAGMSRTVFMQRFTSTVGLPPARYVTERRLLHAARLLRQTGLSIGEIADGVGYGSLTSFVTAFRLRFDSPPARWRREGAGRTEGHSGPKNPFEQGGHARAG